MRCAWGVAVVLFLLGTSAQGWSGSDGNKSVSDLERMSDEELLAEAVGPCVAARENGSAAMEYLRTIAQVARKHHNDEPQAPFSNMLVAAAAENPAQCRKVGKAGVKAAEPPKANTGEKPASTADNDDDSD